MFVCEKSPHHHIPTAATLSVPTLRLSAEGVEVVAPFAPLLYLIPS
jgi:hypothetical protein